MLVVSFEERARVHARCRAAAPAEACGLLLGLRRGATRRVVEAVQLPNRETAAADRFRVAPDDFARVAGAARDRGLDVVGTWHSHPSGSARPSGLDRAAAQRGWSHWIVGVAFGRVVEEDSHELRADGSWVAEPIVAPDEPAATSTVDVEATSTVVRAPEPAA